MINKNDLRKAISSIAISNAKRNTIYKAFSDLDSISKEEFDSVKSDISKVIESMLTKDTVGKANGVASLDSNGSVPIEQLSNIDTTLFLIVRELPTTDIKTNKIYLVPNKDDQGNNIYVEYLYVENVWENLGEVKAEVDLSEYVNKLSTEIIYDVSAHNDCAVFGSLQDLLSSSNLSTLIPTSVRHGGMSIRFVQSSDNKYVQYRLIADTFNTNIANWQGVDDEPTAGSENLVKSGGVFDEMQGIESIAVPGVITPIATKGGYWVNNDGTYEAYDVQTTDIVRVRKGARISVSFTTGYMTLRYGLFSSMPAANDTTSIHGGKDTSPCVITIQNDGYLALSHITSVAIEISSLGQPVDNVPTRNSGNTVKSGGVYDVIKGLADEIHSYVNWDGLSISYIKEVEISGNLFNIAKKISDDGYYISSVNSDGTLIFLDAAGYRSYLIPVDGISTYSFTYGRCVVLMKDETHAVDGASVQTYTNSISSVGAKYIAFSFNNETYPESTYQVGIGSLQAEPVFKIPYLKVGTDNLEDESVNTGKLKSKAVTFDKIGFSVPGKNLFNINDHDNVIGKYISGNIFYEDDGSYNTTGYIQVKPNTTYQCSNDGEIREGVYLARFVCQYGSDKSYISDLQPSSANNRFTTTANTYFIRVSAKGAYWDKYQIEKGFTPTAWEPYLSTIDPQYLPKESFGHFEGSATLAQNGTLTLPQSYSRKNIAFSALIDGTDNANLDVLIGLGYNKFRGAWLELTPTKVIVHEYTLDDATTEYTHGLTLGSSTIVSFDAGTTEATIRVISDGNMFSQNIDKGFFFGGAAFITNKGSNSIDTRLSVVLKDVTKKVWLFGDSYLSWDSSARWPYWILQWGFKSWMSDSLPGGNSYIGYTSFINDKKIGKPTYLLWANGMNDDADTDINTPNSAWKQCIDSVIAECAELGITPILATIPSVPNIYHEGKNKWIRESGYRYVDFAAAVGANSAGVWKTGMLNSDNIHPTTLGAKALASQVLINFPEIMVE